MLEEFKKYYAEWGWVLNVFLIIFATLVFNYVVSKVYKKLHPRLLRTERLWDDAVVEALYLPVKVLLWLLGFTYALAYIGHYVEKPTSVHIISGAREIGMVFILVWFLTRFIKEIEKNLMKPKAVLRHKMDRTTLSAVTQLLRLAVFITAGLILLQTFGIPISGLLAFGGIGGLAVGFAAKDLLANFFGGLMIFLDRPFRIGDWIRSPDKEVEGTVEHIGWRLTRIRTFDKRPLFVPNALFSTVSIENPSRMENRRIKTTIGIRYEDSKKMAVILKDIEDMLKNHPEIDTNKVCFVNLINFGPYSLEFLVYTFTKTTNWVKFQGIQQDVFLKILDVIHSHGADCAFPTTTLHTPDGIEIKKS